MRSVADAQQLILNQAHPLPAQSIALRAGLLGRLLAEDVVSDRDVPAADKSLMDGYAVRSDDLPEGRATLTVIEEITAGRVPSRPLALRLLQSCRPRSPQSKTSTRSLGMVS